MNDSTEPVRCTAAKSHGRFCDRESLPDAPFPICLKHASQILRYLDSWMPGDLESRLLIAVRGIDNERAQKAERERFKPRLGQVYYIRVGEYIKIGYSDNVASRVRSYPPGSKLLAVESGTVSLEVQRHRQFSEHRAARNEWYRPHPELMAHIDRVRSGNAAA